MNEERFCLETPDGPVWLDRETWDKYAAGEWSPEQMEPVPLTEEEQAGIWAEQSAAKPPELSPLEQAELEKVTRQIRLLQEQGQYPPAE